MKYINYLKSVSYFENSLYDYALAVVIFVGLLIALKIIKVFIIGRLRYFSKKTNNDFDDVLIESLGNIKPPFYFLAALYFSIRSLNLNEMAGNIVYALFLAVFVYEAVNALGRLVDYFSRKYLAKVSSDGEEVHSQAMVGAVNLIAKIFLWALGLILFLDNLGLDVTSLIASLGIGGVAVALALQNILKDLFSSFSIYVDKPFVTGDFIVVGDDAGTVEKIGLKTTRIKTLQGEELVVSNTELTSARVQNFKKMQSRRVAFDLGVIYETKEKLLKEIPEMVEKIIKDTPDAEFDRCHFKKFGDSSLMFETVFFVASPDYNTYMDTRQKVNYEIFETFNKAGIEFAYPTQKVLLSK